MHQKPLRHRRLSSLLAACCLIFTQLTFPADDSASLMYENALADFRRGDIKEAKIRLKNALRDDPTQVASHLLMADIHLKEFDGFPAEKELIIAQRLGASRTLTLVPLAKAYYLQKKYTELIDSLFPTYQSAQADAELLQWRGAAQLELKQYTDASRSYELAQELAPNSAAPLVGKAAVLLRQGNITLAEAEVNAALKLESDNQDAWHLIGTIHHARGQLDEALADYEKVLAINPEHYRTRIAKVGLLLDLGRAEEAVEIAGQLKELNPSDPRPAYLQSIAATQLGDSTLAKNAMKEAEDVLGRLSETQLETHAPTTMLAGLVYYALAQWEKAYKYLEIYIGGNPGQAGPRKLLGSLMLGKGEVDKAIDVLEPALRSTPKDPRLLTLLGEAYSKKNQYVKADDILNEALRQAPDNVEARAKRASNNLARGEPQAALSDLHEVYEKRPDMGGVGVHLILTYLREKEFKKAVEIAAELIVRHPNNVTYLNLLASAQSYAGQIDAARENYDHILVIDPGFLPAQINLGKLEYRYGRAQEAQIRFTKLLETHPENTLIAAELARAYRAQNKTGDAIRWFKKAITNDPEQLDAVVDLVDLLLSIKQYKQALETAQEAEVTSPRDLRVMEALGRSYLALGRKVDARNMFRTMSGEAGYDAERLEKIAKYQLQTDDLKGAIWSLQKAVEESPKRLATQLLLSNLFIRDGKADKAMDQGKAIKDIFPDLPAGDLILGDLATAQSHYDDALNHYRAAAARNAGAAANLGESQVYMAMGDVNRATNVLQTAKTNFPDNPQISQALAEAYISNQQWDKAATEYEQQLKQNPHLVGAMNNLAFIYAKNGDARALPLARQAFQAAPKNPSVNDTLGWILHQQGNTAEGLRYLRNASVFAPNKGEIHYHLASALFHIGQMSEARIEAQKALKSGTGTGWSEKAAELIRDIDASVE